MGYFKIGKYNVFYSDDRFIEINKPFYENLSVFEMIGMKMTNGGKLNKKALQLQKLQIEKINKDLKIYSKQRFYEKWVEFEFLDEKAKNISWEIIYDYFEIHKNGQIREIRDFDSQLLDSYEGNSYNFPQGETIELEFILSSNKGILSNLFNKHRTLTTVVNLTMIEKIKGTLSEIIIQTNNQVLKLGKDIVIMNKTVANSKS